MKIKFLLLTSLFLVTIKANHPKRFILTDGDTSDTFETDFVNNSYDNLYEVQVVDESMMENGKHLFLIFESQSTDFKIEIYDKTGKQAKTAIYTMHAMTGSLCLVATENQLNKKLEVFKKNGMFDFRVINNNPQQNTKYNLKIEIGNSFNAKAGLAYTTLLDTDQNELKINFSYNGIENPNLKKLRFQATSIKEHSKYQMSATLSGDGQTYTMNNVFQKTVGGILSVPELKICQQEKCIYTMDLKFESIKRLSIESNLIQDIQVVEVDHYEAYYDKTYQPNQVVYYKLPYTDQIEGLDISISVIPVSGESGLYINAKTKPLSLDKYDFKETGPLGKRITVKWEELEQMDALKSDLYIAVDCPKPGEFALKIDAHEQGSKGRLSPGIIEAGFVKYEEFVNYLFFFEVYETQNISFKVDLNVISGDSDLYLSPCDKISECQITKDSLTNEKVLKVENTQSKKNISVDFTCNNKKAKKVKTCRYVIAVKGKENHGTHYDISLTENLFHLLMIPGKQIEVNLNANETQYLKFSYPSQNLNNKLFLQIEHNWGENEIYFSRTNPYPNKDDNLKVLENDNNNKGLLDSFKSLEVNQTNFGISNNIGIYYIAVNAKTECQVKLKFFEKSEDQTQVSIHTLIAGQKERGQITSSDEILYYTIKISLDHIKNQKARVNLTPLKGDYILFANKNGKLPTKDQNEFQTDENYLNLPIKENGKEITEYIIGVQLTSTIQNLNDNYQFLISFGYDSKAAKLIPQVIETHKISKNNLFFIEVQESMNSIMVLKTIVDGYSIDLCLSFSQSESFNSSEDCEFKAENKQTGIYLQHEILQDKCANRKPCYIHLKVNEGAHDEKFQIGYTYNNLPFQINKAQMLTSPVPFQKTSTMKFIYHVDPQNPVQIYFNSKGHQISLYSKLIDSTNTKDLEFPDENQNDQHSGKDSFVQTFVYEKSKFSDMQNPEILITIKKNSNFDETLMFDMQQHFLLQIYEDSKELIRTHTQTEILEDDQWQYFHFYNSGGKKSLTIQANSNDQVMLTLIISKGLKVRPPITDKGIITQSGMGSVMIELNKQTIENLKNANSIHGNYVVALKSKKKTTVNIFWNNKADLDFIELTPGKQNNIKIQSEKTLFFEMFVQEAKDSKNGKIVFYFQSNLKLEVLMIKSLTSDLTQPSEQNFVWKAKTQQIGGLTAIEIDTSDPDYCVNCNYIGSIKTNKNGQIKILGDIEHHGVPIELHINSPFPCYLEPHGQKKYKLYNPDADLIDLTVSMISGYVDLYVDSKEDLTREKFKENFSLRANLEPHKLITIAPLIKYGIDKAHDFYVLIINTMDQPTSLILNLDKNDKDSSIVPGITRYARLAPGETKNFSYTPQPNENLFEIQFELRGLYQEKYKKQALSLIQDYVNIYLMGNQGQRYLMKYKSKSYHYNRVYINMDISENQQGTFNIHVYNPVASGVYFSVNLLNGGYRLLNLNEHTVDKLEPQKSLYFEAHGQKDKFLFFDMKMCSGDVKVQFTEIDKKRTQKMSKYKTIKDNNTFLHYLKVKNQKMLIKIKNESDKIPAYFDMSAYIEKDMNNSPYSEVTQLEDGKIIFETESKKVKFKALQIKSNYGDNFIHRVTYTLYLTANFKAMRYAKNCGEFMLDQRFPETVIYVFDIDFSLNDAQVQMHEGEVVIEVDKKIQGGVKYYGIVVAEVAVLPQDLGYLTPVRTNKIFYDEFIMQSGKFEIPFMMVISIVIIFGFILMIIQIIRSYVFGKINKMKGLEMLRDLKDIDEGSLGYNVMKAMESEFYKEMQQKEQEQQEQENDIEQKIHEENVITEIEMQDQGDDKEQPLDIENN